MIEGAIGMATSADVSKCERTPNSPFVGSHGHQFSDVRGVVARTLDSGLWAALVRFRVGEEIILAPIPLLERSQFLALLRVGIADVIERTNVFPIALSNNYDGEFFTFSIQSCFNLNIPTETLC